MEQMNCEYCDATFKTKSSLIYHQKTAKYCVKLRPEYVPEKYECELCNKTFILKDSYTKHQVSCGNSEVLKRLRREINDKNAQIMKLETLLETKEMIINNQKEQIENMINMTKILNQRPIEECRYPIENRENRETKENTENNEGENEQPNIFQCLKNAQITPEITLDQNNLLQIASEMIEASEVRTTLDFVKSFMFALDSKEQFPLNIEILVERGVFDTKGNAKRTLLKYFVKDTDYKISKQNTRKFMSETENENKDEIKVASPAFLGRKAGAKQILNNTESNEYTNVSERKARSDGMPFGGAGGNKETIMLTTECFKSLSQTAMNEVGRQTRLYYQDMEKILKKYIVVEYNNRINYQNSEIKRINRNHNVLLKRRTYYQFNEGPCMYLLSFDGKHKFGFSENINKVLPGERRMAPSLRVEYIVYSPMAYRLEQNMLLKHSSDLETLNHEIVVNLTTEKLIESTRKIIDALNLEHQEENNVSEYNNSE